MKYLLFLLLFGCTETIHVVTDPIIVTHTIDMSLIKPACENKCKNDVNPSLCTTSCINDFLLTLVAVSVK
jgi:hypothetical protein